MHSLNSTLSELQTEIREYEYRLRKIENDEWIVPYPQLLIPYLKVIIKEKRLFVLLFHIKEDNKTLQNMIKEKLRQSVTERMEHTTELVEVQQINENAYLELSNEMKELYDVLL
jgi:nicotinamide mononucleotide adenylyltransferase